MIAEPVGPRIEGDARSIGTRLSVRRPDGKVERFSGACDSAGAADLEAAG